MSLGSRVAPNASVKFEIASAGVRGWDGARMDASAAAELRRLGADSGDFTARSLSAHLVEQADLILTATKDHRRAVLELAPQALSRSFTILEFSDLATSGLSVHQTVESPRTLVRRAFAHRGSQRSNQLDLADPYGGSPEVHRHTAEVVYRASCAIAAALAPERGVCA